MMAGPASNSDSEGPQSGVRTADSSFVSGEASPFESGYWQYFDFVWSSVRRLGVSSAATDDVVQEVFIVIHSRLHTLERPQALRSWIYGVVRRTVSSHHRAQRAKAVSGVQLAVETEAQVGTPPTPSDLTE